MGCKNHQIKNQSDNKMASLENNVAELVEKIKSDNYMGTPYIARSTTKDPAFLRKQKLYDIATDKQLVELANHPNPIVSLTAFQELYNRNHSSISQVFENYFTNTDFITFVKGDVVLEMSVLEYAYTQVLQYDELHNHEGFNQGNKSKLNLSAQDQMKVVTQIKKLNSMAH